MRQSDIFSIILIATVGMLAAFFGANAVIGDPDMENVTYKKVVDINSTLAEPDPELFNGDAINPTVEVEIDNCEDTNGNGILDADERRRCLNQEESVESETSDGTSVLERIRNGESDSSSVDGGSGASDASGVDTLNTGEGLSDDGTDTGSDEGSNVGEGGEGAASDGASN